MRKLLLLFMLASSFTFSQNLILTEDTFVDHDENYLTVRTNGFDLTINGSLVVTNFIMLNGGGTIKASDDIIVGSNIYFFNDNGAVKSETGISVSSDVVGVGTLSYCTFLNVPLYDETVTIIQDCSLSLPLVEYIKNVPTGEPYLVVNMAGQIIKEGVFKDSRDIYFKEVAVIKFPRLGYSSKMRLKTN